MNIRVRANHNGLSPNQKLVLHVLADYCADGTDTCWPGVMTIAAEVGICVRQTRRLLEQLCEAKFISVAARGRGVGNFTTYRVHPEEGKAARARVAHAGQMTATLRTARSVQPVISWRSDDNSEPDAGGLQDRNQTKRDGPAYEDISGKPQAECASGYEDISDELRGHFGGVMRTSGPSYIEELETELEAELETTYPLPLSCAVEPCEKQPQPQPQPPRLPEERKNQGAGFERQRHPRSARRRCEGQATATATARRDKRSERQWQAVSAAGTETGVAAAAGRVLRACGLSSARTLPVIVTAMEGFLAADRTREVSDAERLMVASWQEYRRLGPLLKWVAGEKKFFERLWLNQGLWPIDQARLTAARRL